MRNAKCEIWFVARTAAGGPHPPPLTRWSSFPMGEGFWSPSPYARSAAGLFPVGAGLAPPGVPTDLPRPGFPAMPADGPVALILWGIPARQCRILWLPLWVELSPQATEGVLSAGPIASAPLLNRTKRTHPPPGGCTLFVFAFSPCGAPGGLSGPFCPGVGTRNRPPVRRHVLQGSAYFSSSRMAWAASASSAPSAMSIRSV